MLWMRSDGQRDAGNPVLTAQFEAAGGACANEREQLRGSLYPVDESGARGLRANAARDQAVNEVVKRCMAKQGYLLVPEEQAESRRQELLAIEVEKKRRDAAAAPPARKPAPAR
jgi:hypothetical protein